MKAISHRLASRVKHLRRNGFSYKEIAEKLPVSVGTSYNYAKDVKVMPAGMKRLKSRQGNGRPPKEVSIVKELTVEKTRIISHCLFDVSVIINNGDYVVKYTNASHGLIRQFVSGMRKIYGMSPGDIRLYQGKNHPWWEVMYRSKRVVEDLLRYSPTYSTSNSVGLPKGIARKRKFIQTFLRAFWDDEGCIAQSGALTLYSNSRRLILDAKQLHEKLGIRCSVYRKKSCFVLRVKGGLENLRRFQRKVGFTESIIVRGKAIGSKKRAVLANFLASYKSK
ncbi:hypothetical protein AKJ44_00385 [candidate division MSBL1 archaeon SCGC-AAA261F17]|uniref:Homing endonuclease LAGLIDADG domain-containing protein n=1 Tax=candidate division MSBL1 archaeon SCGC-AAA261F17 TaxID=1698274 RepID=A0A133V7Q1_9EURY|nr:hypothetical protein AKJ44_00385 [candidate division MSBL1 archaeon SCGC-AAA261F17]